MKDDAAYFVKYEMEKGETILIESTAQAGIERINDNDNTSTAGEKFEKALEQIKPVAKALRNALQELNKPEEIQLEFGVKFSAKAGIIFASADSEAAFKIALKWDNRR